MFSLGLRNGLSGLSSVTAKIRKQQDEEEAKRKELMTNIRGEASDFRKNLGSYKEGLINDLMPTYRAAEEEGTRRTREGASRRGLLYSGLEKKQESANRGTLAATLAQQKANINNEAETLARKKESAAASAGLAESQMLMQQAEDYYNISMQNQLNRRKAMGSLFSGIGYAIGSSSYKPEDQTKTGNQGLISMNTYGPYETNYNVG